jgi:hypothetical protein
MLSMFEVAAPALKASGVLVSSTWDETKVRTLSQAKAQLARRGIRLQTAAKWAKAATIVAAGITEHPQFDPRPTAYHGPRR